jgi:hypothetical protein
MSDNFPASINIGELVKGLAICDVNHADIADAIGIGVDQMRRDYRYELRAREELLDDAAYCARMLIKKLKIRIEEGTHEQMPRHVFNESAKMVVETLKSKGGWTVNPVTATLNYDMSDPQVIQALKTLGVLVG